MVPARGQDLDPRAPQGGSALLRWALACFFLSGITGLVYEVLWTRRLTLTFGHTVLAVSTVLTVFMAGLASGSFAVGRWVDRRAGGVARPGPYFLAVYGALELFIGIWASVSLPLLDLVERAYLGLSTSGASGVGLQLACFAGSFLVLLPPTMAMGATVPVMSRLLVGEIPGVGRLLSRLYGVNTLGAVVGAGLAGFWLLPTFGLAWSLGGAASLNGAIGLAALWLGRSGALAPPSTTGLPEPASPEPAEACPAAAAASPPGWLVPLAFGAAGVASMAYQVGWTRGLALSLGSSVYAFSAILVSFLGGLGLGSLLYPRVLGARTPRLVHLAGLQLTLGLSGAATVVALGALPWVFFRAFPLVGESFWRVLVLDLFLASGVLLGPTFLMGLAFPLATHLYARDLRALGRRVGEVYSANTLGCILGAFLSGFVLVPRIGAQSTLKGAALLNLALALLLLPWCRTRPVWLAGLAVAGAAGILWLPPWDPGVMAGGVAVYAERHQGMSSQELQRTLFRPPAFYRDGLSATVTMNYYSPEEMAMRVNGKVDASLGKADKQTMYLTGYLPGLIHPGPRRAAVIGLGSGFTLEALARIPELEELACVELEPAVVEAASYWAGYNGRVLEDPRVRIHTTDGRTWVMGSPQAWDLIVSEPSNPWLAGIGNLYTREFYTTCHERLAADGVMCQWLNLYALSQEDLAMVFHSFFSVFPHGTIWQSAPADCLLIGSKRPARLDPGRVARVWGGDERVRSHFYEIGLFGPGQLAGQYLFDREAAWPRVSQAPFNTDDRPLLEFSAPLSLYRKSQIAENRDLLWSLRPPGDPSPAGPAAVERALGRLNLGDQESVEAAMAAMPPGPWRSLLAGLLAQERQQPDEARAALEEALRLDPGLALAADRLGRLELAAGRLEQAEAWLERALAAPPAGGEGPLRTLLGLVRLLREAPARAVAPLERAVALQGVSQPARLLGDALARAGRPEEAQAAWSEAVRRNPGDFLAWISLGKARYAQGQVGEAQSAFREALARVPDDLEAGINLGICLLSQGRHREAEQAFAVVLRAWPEHPAARELLQKARAGGS